MLKYIPLLLICTSCQSFGIQDTDTVQEAELKVIHVIEDDIEMTSPAVKK